MITEGSIRACGCVCKAASAMGIKIKPEIIGDGNVFVWHDPVGTIITGHLKPTKQEALIDACDVLVTKHFTRK